MADGDALARASPVVLTGRGGSGTRLLSQLALPAGVFLGSQLNESFDSVEWTEVIYEIGLDVLAGDRWRPGQLRDWAAALRRRAASMLASASDSAAELWGWKLPETMLILPAVRAAFPRARYVHLVRHPVTSCLRRTHLTSRLDNPVGRVALAAAYAYCQRDLVLIEADPAHVCNAVSWRFQVEKAEAFFREGTRPASRLDMRYEAICADPAAEQARLFAFLGRSDWPLRPPRVQSERWSDYDPDDEAAKEVWAICGAVGERFGYALRP